MFWKGGYEMDARNDSQWDAFLTEELGKKLSKSFDTDEIIMSDQLMEKTLKAIQNNESPRISEEVNQRNTRKRKNIRFLERGVIAAACFVLLIGGVNLLVSFDGSKGNLLKMDDNSMDMELTEEAGNLMEKNGQIAENNTMFNSEEESGVDTTEDKEIGSGLVSFYEVSNLHREDITRIEIVKGSHQREPVISREITSIHKMYDLMEETTWNVTEEKSELKDWNYKVDFYGKKNGDSCSIYIYQSGIQVEKYIQNEKTVVFYDFKEYTIVEERIEIIIQGIAE